MVWKTGLLTLALSLPAAASLSDMVADEARALQSDAERLVDLSKQADFSALENDLMGFADKLEGLHTKLLAAKDPSSSWTAEQQEAYALILKKVDLMKHFAGLKAELVRGNPMENRKLIRAKASNLMDRAKRLEKAASATSLPPI